MANNEVPLPLGISLDDGDLEAPLDSLGTTIDSSDQPSLHVMGTQLQDIDANNMVPKQLTCLECHQPVLEEVVNQHIYCKHMDAMRLIRCSLCHYSVKYNLASMIVHCQNEHSDLALVAQPIDERDLHLATAEQQRQKCFPDSVPLNACNSEAERASVAKKLTEWQQNSSARQLAKARQEKLFPPAAVKKRKSNGILFEPLSPPVTGNDHHSSSATGEGSKKRWHIVAVDGMEEEEGGGQEDSEQMATIPSVASRNRGHRQCAVCTMTVRTTDSSQHLWNHHMEVARYACHHCSFTVKKRSRIVQHVRRVHPQEALAFVDRKDELQPAYYEAFHRCFGTGNHLRLRFSKRDASSAPSAGAVSDNDEAEMDTENDRNSTAISDTAKLEESKGNGEGAENNESDFPSLSSFDAHQTTKAQQEKRLFPAETPKLPKNRPWSPAPLDDQDQHHLAAAAKRQRISDVIDAVVAKAGKEKDVEEGKEAEKKKKKTAIMSSLVDALTAASPQHRQCTLCTMSIRNKNTSHHVWCQHMEVARFACHYCPWATKNLKREVIRHLHSAHPNEAPAYVDRKDELLARYQQTFSRCFRTGSSDHHHQQHVIMAPSGATASDNTYYMKDTADTEAMMVAETADDEKVSEATTVNASKFSANDSSTLDARQRATFDDTGNIVAIFEQQQNDNIEDDAKDMEDGNEETGNNNAALADQQTLAEANEKPVVMDVIDKRIVAMVRDVDEYAAIVLQMAIRLKKPELARASTERLKAKLSMAPETAMKTLIIADQMRDLGLMEAVIDVIKGD